MFKEFVRKIVIAPIAQGIKRDFPLDLHFRSMKNTASVDKGVQILLMLKYRELLQEGLPLPKFEEAEFRVFSQNGEDGILHYIFSLIGTLNRRGVELCAGNGIECNAANLILNHGWTALLIDRNANQVKIGRKFYAKSRDTFYWPPTFVSAWATAENVNSIIRSNGFEGEIDLLSLDVDGMDYWIWKAIDCIEPRVVLLEYNNLWGPEKSVTVPYAPDFKAEHNRFGVDYGGASLNAFVRLGKKKGYRLVGCQRYCFNAFFIRRGIGEDIFPEIAPANCFQHPSARYAVEKRLLKVLNREWLEV